MLTIAVEGKQVAFDIELSEINDGSSSGMLLAMAEEASRGPSTWTRLSLPDGKPIEKQAQLAQLSQGIFAYVPPLRVLLALKRSHLHLGIQWQKHMQDYHILKKHLAKAVSSFKEEEEDSQQQLAKLQKARELEGTARYGESKVHLDVSNQEFFKVHYLKEMLPPDHLARGLKPGHLIYTHDELHRLVMYGEEPVYEQLKLEPSKAKLERSLFEQLPHELQLRLVREEAMAICTERMIIPQLLAGKRPHVQNTYSQALSMVLTTLSKGWFRDFGLEHWSEVKQCDRDLVRIIARDGRLHLPQYSLDHFATSAGDAVGSSGVSSLVVTVMTTAGEDGAESDCSIEEISAAEAKMLDAHMVTIDATALQAGGGTGDTEAKEAANTAAPRLSGELTRVKEMVTAMKELGAPRFAVGDAVFVSTPQTAYFRHEVTMAEEGLFGATVGMSTEHTNQRLVCSLTGTNVPYDVRGMTGAFIVGVGIEETFDHDSQWQQWKVCTDKPEADGAEAAAADGESPPRRTLARSNSLILISQPSSHLTRTPSRRSPHRVTSLPLPISRQRCWWWWRCCPGHSRDSRARDRAECDDP
jgi:hypothetical protein